MSAVTIAWLIGALAVSIYAQGRPGIDRPIRVGSFIGTGIGAYWVESTRPGNYALSAMLANPDSAGLGPDLIVPPKGFSFTMFGSPCQSCPFSPTATQTEAFISALDTLDVVYIGCFSNLGNIITFGLNRDKLLNFMTTKAYVGVNRVTDSPASWSDLDFIHGARFAGHPSARKATLRRDSVAENGAEWKYLNQGLFPNRPDTTLNELWYFWTTSGEKIRAGNSLGSMIITVKMPEESLEGGFSPQTPMGDHPMSWGRRVARRQEQGPNATGYVFQNLRPGVYALAVTSGQSRTTRLVAVP